MPTRVHEVTFERVEDAAAFMATVSRHVASPDAPRVDDLRVDVELLSPGARVYLTDNALMVAEVAFGPVPRVSVERGSLPPASRVGIDLLESTAADLIVQRLSAHYRDLANHAVA